MTAVCLDLDALNIFNPRFELDELLVLEDLPSLAPPLPPIDFANGVDTTILVFDQAIANTGWALFHIAAGHVPTVVLVGTIKTKTLDDRSSWDDTLERSTRVAEAVKALIVDHMPDLVLHEMPPVGTGPFVRRSESSVVAATAIRVVAHQMLIPVAHVSAQRVKKHLTGNGNAKKNEVREAIEKRIASGTLNVPMMRMNEHIFDAIGICITYQEQL